MCREGGYGPSYHPWHRKSGNNFAASQYPILRLLCTGPKINIMRPKTILFRDFYVGVHGGDQIGPLVKSEKLKKPQCPEKMQNQMTLANVGISTLMCDA